jgi:hypothetical protein
MRLLLLALLLALLAGTARADDAANRAAMEVLDAFMHAFNARDVDAWAATLNYPHVRFASGTVSVYEDAAAFGGRDAFAMLVQTGWDHSHWLTRDIVLSAPDKVHINTRFQRFNADNAPIGTYESLYIVTRVDGRWGIQARSSLAP